MSFEKLNLSTCQFKMCTDISSTSLHYDLIESIQNLAICDWFSPCAYQQVIEQIEVRFVGVPLQLIARLARSSVSQPCQSGRPFCFFPHCLQN